MDELIAIERGFWLGDLDHYDARVAEDALFALPTMPALLDKAHARAVRVKLGPWDSVEMRDLNVQSFAGGLRIVTYEAYGIKGATRYHVLISTTFRDGQLVHHQQTPLGG